jgi:hypothetical protein
MIREHELPPCVRAALTEARAARPGRELTCIAFRTVEGDHVTTRSGPASPPGLRARDVLVLSVTVTETTCDAVRTATHVLVTLARQRAQSAPSPEN